MTGAERLEQVREALGVSRTTASWTQVEAAAQSALAALDGCVLLTADEARRVEGLAQHAPRCEGWYRCTCALALLTPSEREAK
jgi:hypothetical protein